MAIRKSDPKANASGSSAQQRGRGVQRSVDGGAVQTSETPNGEVATQGTIRTLKVAILGFGTVGSSVARILSEAGHNGLELTHVLNRDVERKRVPWVPRSVVWTSDFNQVLASDADVLVELAGGLEPAGEWASKALSAGKAVVTANKKLIAYRGIELSKLAASNRVPLLYGAAVAGGVPVIPGLQLGLCGDQLHRVEGILNGTCNFILSKMEAGAEFEAALLEAKALGYAEADPSEDVDGFDARAKLVILTRIGLHADITPEEIPTHTITGIEAIDFEYARDLHCTIRQISRADARGREILATVGPMLVPHGSPLAGSRGTENMVVVSGKYGGDTVFSGRGAGGLPTAVAVVSDLLSIREGQQLRGMPVRRTTVSGEVSLRHYIRFIVNDRPGIVAEIATHLAEHHINIQAILQKPGHPGERLPFVVTVEPCPDSALRRALGKIAGMDCFLEPPLQMQILEPEEAAG
ncbi:MAG TPA: homoserine dehydrogenase [Acidisarcina sp.]